MVKIGPRAKTMRCAVSIATNLAAAELVRYLARCARAPRSVSRRVEQPGERVAVNRIVAFDCDPSPMNRGGAIPCEQLADPIDDASQLSFPASDAPSWTPG